MQKIRINQLMYGVFLLVALHLAIIGCTKDNGSQVLSKAQPVTGREHQYAYLSWPICKISGVATNNYPIIRMSVHSVSADEKRLAASQIIGLTDYFTKTDIPFNIGNKYLDNDDLFEIKPSISGVSGKAFNVTLLAGSRQHIVEALGSKRYDMTDILGEDRETVAIFYYSRPTISRIDIGYKEDGDIEYFVVHYSEQLNIDDLNNIGIPELNLDDHLTEACVWPFQDCRTEKEKLDKPVINIPSTRNVASMQYNIFDKLKTFNSLRVKIAGAVRGIENTVFDGASEEKHSSVQGDFVFYNYIISDFIDSQNRVKTWCNNNE